MSAGAYVQTLQLGSLELDLNDVDNNGFIIASIDLGAPTPRAVVTDLPGQDGQQDDTAFFGPRSIQLTGAIVPSAAGSRTKAKDKLAPFLAASGRPTLLYALDPDVDVRCLTLRIGQWSNVIDHPENATAFSVQWVGAPIALGKSTNEIDLPLAHGSLLGFDFPLSFPFSFGGASGPAGDTVVLIGGTYPTWPVLQIFGPVTDPKVIWLEPISGAALGTQVVFTGGLEIDDGDYLEVDTRAKTALVNGDPAANRYNFLDFAASSLGPLAAGPNLLRFTAAAASTDAICKVLWREAFLD